MRSIRDTSDWVAAGMTALGYEWFYVPLMKGWGIEPWSLTWYGCLMLGIGFVVAIINGLTNYQVPSRS